MRIVIYTQYFPPETGAPQARLYELAIRLIRQDHEVIVLTAMPNYPDGVVFPGYRWRLSRVEAVDGIKVIRTALFPSRSARAIPRLLSYVSFAVLSLFLGGWRVGRSDLLLFESPPLFLAPSALILGKLIGARTIMNVSDIWPDILIRMGSIRPGLALRSMHWLEQFSYRHSDVVAVTNPGAAAQLRERFPHVDITVISNGVDTRLFTPELRSQKIRSQFRVGEDEILIVYCGLLGVAQGLDTVIRAANALQHRTEINFVIIGDGPERERIRDLICELNASNVNLCGRRPKNNIPAILASADLGLVPLSSRLPGTMPSKIYETLAAGLPVVVAGGCEGEALVEQNDVGRSYEPTDPEDLAKSIEFVCDNTLKHENIRGRCRKLSKRFCRDLIAQQTEEIFRAVVSGAPLPNQYT